jgi:hypothetical protein
MSKHAEVEVNGNKAPVLSPGTITPEILRRFENACKNFFRTKKIEAEGQVSAVAGNMHDPLVSDWYWTDEARINALSFDNFMKEMCVKWLKKGWEQQIRRRVLGTKQNGDVFWEWAVKMRGLNALLRDTTSHLDDTVLRNQLEANLDSHLCIACDDEKINDILDLEQWLTNVKNMDEKRRWDRVQAKADADAAAKENANKRSAASAGLSEPSHRSNTNTVPFRSTTKPAVSDENSKPFKKIAKLTLEERAILRANNGCFKCRRVNAGHLAKDCPEDGPVSDVKRPPSNSEIKETAPHKPVAAVIGNFGDNFGDVDLGVSTSGSYMPTTNAFSLPHVEVVGTSSFPVAAIMPPPNEFGVLMGEGEITDDSVSTLPHLSDPVTGGVPLSVPHLRWRAAVNEADPARLGRKIVNTMIDDGSHLVLVAESLVESLRLRRFKLHKPLPMNLALKDKTKPDDQFTEWTKLKLYDPENNWAARTMRAVVAPSLCTDVLLGLPFLVSNNLVIDYAKRTCTDKISGFDLLNPCKPPRAPAPKPKLKEMYTKIMNNRKEVIRELSAVCANIKERIDSECEQVLEYDLAGAVRTRIEQLSFKEQFARLDESVKRKYDDVFAPIPHVNELPNDVYCKITLKDASKVIATRSYACPRKYRDAWKTLLQQHLDAGRIRPSSSTHASPAFIIPKADCMVLPRWVNDYRQLNANTVHDRFPLPRIDDILADCAKGKIWSVIDMTNSFFQTLVHPDNISKTAVTTPFGLYEWVVMPMGLKNAPAIHQRRVAAALREHIGSFCHVYLDDIIIWSENVTDHVRHIDKVMESLRKNRLYGNAKKSQFFLDEVKFLGHKISQKGVEACDSKVEKVLNWPRPRSATEVKGFLGLVRYIAAFLPKLAQHTVILNPLTSNEAKKKFPQWTDKHEQAFDAIKKLVISRECLTVIDHEVPGNNKIFVTCDASDHSTGAVLSWGETWELARPVAFDSIQLKGAELNYPVHEKELLAVMRALRKWRSDLLGSHFYVYTDHRTLTNFDTQKDLSRRQARWQEYLSQFDLTFVYIRGEDNTVADALSRLPPEPVTVEEKVERHRAWRGYNGVNAVLSIAADTSLLQEIRAGYKVDEYCKKLLSAEKGFNEIKNINGLWLAHDTLGHFGAEKSYASLRDSYYWPGMRRDLELGYVPGCIECQRNKSSTQKPRGPLHPLPVPDKRNERVTMDFIGPLSDDKGYNCIMTMTDALGSDIRIIPTTMKLTAEGAAELFFTHWFCENGLPENFACDRDKLFIAKFWRALCKLTGVRLRMSSAYHPETDGSSERSNKTINQAIRYHVSRNQKGWSRALPLIRFQMMNAVNASTNYSGFELRFGRSPRLIPTLDEKKILQEDPDLKSAVLDVQKVLERLKTDIEDAKDSLIASKIQQAFHANKKRNPDKNYKVGEKVMLTTLHRRKEYLNGDKDRVAKFLPRFDGPYSIVDVHPLFSTYELDMPNKRLFPVFHASELKRHVPNDDILFPSRKFKKPGPIVTEFREEEWGVEKIVDERKRGKEKQYLVKWVGYGEEENRWLPRRELEDCQALDEWEKNKVEVTGR